MAGCRQDEFLSFLLLEATVGQDCVPSQDRQGVTGRDPTCSQGCLPRRVALLLQLPDELQQVHL